MTQVSYAPGRAGRFLVALAVAVAAALLFQVGSARATVTGTDDASAVAAAIGDGSPGLVTGGSFTIAGPLAECADGQDNDGNGKVDFPNDTAGCKSATDDSEDNDLEFDFSVPECQNKADDDGDGLIDSGSDPQCAAPTDTDESAPGNQAAECSDGTPPEFPSTNCSAAGDNDETFQEECSDGVDNDDDGHTDLAGGDTGCDFAYDNNESSENPPAASANKQAGVSDGPLAGFPTANSTFGVLTSGDASLADDPNDSGGSGTSNGGQAYGEAFDPLTLKIDINVPQGANCVGFDFRFLSEEYPEFVNAGFNDAFVAQLDQLSVNVSGQSITAPGDFAAGTGDQISVDSSGPSGMADFFAAGTTYDGATPRLVSRTPVDPGAHSIYLTIFDAGDHILDSAVFVDNLRVSTEEPGKCKSLPVEPFEGKTGIGFGGDPSQPISLNADLTLLQFLASCALPAGNELSCNPSFSFTFSPPGTSPGKRADRAAAVPLASGSASIPAGASQAVSLPVTPEGTKAAKAAAAKPAKLKKKAKKLKKKAKKATGKKKKKLLKKAKKLLKQAKQLQKGPLGTVTGTITNPTNGATDTVTFPVPR
jgi:hypothetical protein